MITHPQSTPNPSRPALSSGKVPRPCHRIYRKHLALILFILVSCARAQQSEEVVIVINRNAPDSEKVAKHYAALRGIPPHHLIHVDCPPLHRSDLGFISRKTFVEQIWKPLGQAVQARGLQKKITAVIYSSGFPPAVQTTPAMSLTGITMTQGINPGSEKINTAQVMTPFFAGPMNANGPSSKGLTLRAHHDRHTQALPPASMMLGYDGPRGLTTQEILASLTRSRSADFTQPEAPVYIIDIADVRSKCRRWQIDGSKKALADHGGTFQVAKQWPDHSTPVGGLSAGMKIIPENRSFNLVPGSAAEHLTSLAGHFYSPLQSKCTQWIRHGAVASCGTVSEPFALWPKFPHYRFFSHYRNGLTALESYMASVASPFQLLIVGDPLARPFAEGKPTSDKPVQMPRIEKETFRDTPLEFSQQDDFNIAFPPEWSDTKRLQTTLGWEAKRIFSDQGFSGIVFNYTSPERFDFFGLHGYRGLWMMASRIDGQWKIHQVWGEPIFMQRAYHLEVFWNGKQAVGTVNGRLTCESTLPRKPDGKAGLLKSGNDQARFALNQSTPSRK